MAIEFIVRTAGPECYYLIKGTRKPYIWRRGPNAAMNAVRFSTSAEAQQAINAGYRGANREEAIVVRVQQ